MKITVSDVGYLPKNCSSWRPRGFLKQYRLLQLLLVVHHNYMVSPCSWRHHLLQLYNIEKLRWNWSWSFLFLASFHSFRGCSAGCWERKVISDFSQLWTLSSKILISQTRCSHWYNSGMTSMRPTNCFLIGFSAIAQAGIHARHSMLGQKPMAGEVIGPEREPILLFC